MKLLLSTKNQHPPPLSEATLSYWIDRLAADGWCVRILNTPIGGCQCEIRWAQRPPNSGSKDWRLLAGRSEWKKQSSVEAFRQAYRQLRQNTEKYFAKHPRQPRPELKQVP